jgi:Flp pilus assembly protein TadG
MSLRLLNRLRADERGAAIIEMALVAPVLALGVIGVVDMSNAYSKKLALEQGAQRAIERIMNTTEDTTVETGLATETVCQVNGMNADGTCKTSPITTANVTVSWRLDCTTGGTLTSQTTTDSATYDDYVDNCSGTKAGYVQVTATDTYTPLFPIHFASYDTQNHVYNISATAGTRTM